jgi:hypothetical protein
MGLVGKGLRDVFGVFNEHKRVFVSEEQELNKCAEGHEERVRCGMALGRVWAM